MRLSIALVVIFTIANYCGSQEFESLEIASPEVKRLTGACDFDGFVKTAISLQEYRKARLVSASEFAQLAKRPNTIIVDARAPAAFAVCHVKGSINIPYTTFSESNLLRLIPDKSTRILLYCRNNFQNEAIYKISNNLPVMEVKHAWAGLNIPTFITLQIYGYQEIWELDDIVDPRSCVIDFEIASSPSKIVTDPQIPD
jgi:rhodanese-related sulfurtransferase